MAFDLSAFQKTLVYQAHAPVPEVLEDLKVIGQLDQKAEAARKTLWISAWVVLVIGVLSLFVVGPLGLAPIALAVGLFIVRARRRRTDLEDRRYGLVATLLQRLQVDLEKDAVVELTLDLSPNDEVRKRVAEGTRGRWKCEDFTETWLQLQGRFADGTHLHLSMVEHLQKRSRTQRNARGKTKTKRKQKGKALMQVSLRVKPERHPGLAALDASARSAARLPPGIQVSRIRVGADRVEMRALLAHDWVARAPKPVPPLASLAMAPSKGRKPKAPVVPPGKHDASRTATMMLLSLYQVLNFSSSQRRRSDARATS
ncbi:hypothetical protein D7Y13_16360 [Corallococcus praedator]|uniref:DUF2244 domain-containing protein n=1 Tax=Corallococcus praedator TaxID=2316724 RepID=A0ABX9QHK0_9BACT|nr:MULTISPECIES: hypothetical protein [Corallococcus]RKH29647.1 hypothetical protein D7X75_22485 [Corallococcus sp. CA031C]RKI08248.1 hypothetical protein D7Y13_16360 [Corallococcus praedator]